MTPYEFAILFLLLFAAILLGLETWANAKFRKRVQDSFERFEYERLKGETLVAESVVEDISATINSDEFLTADQVAVMLQVSKTTVYAWANNGYIPALKIRGGSQKNVWRFSRRDIEAWIAEQKQPVTAKDLFANKENVDETTGTG